MGVNREGIACKQNSFFIATDFPDPGKREDNRTTSKHLVLAVLATGFDTPTTSPPFSM